MKHLSQLNVEFAKKAAASWDDLSRNVQLTYLGQHPHSKRRLTSTKPLDIAKHGKKETKQEYLTNLAAGIAHEANPDEKALMLKYAAFMHKFLPNEFRSLRIDEDSNISMPNFKEFVNKHMFDVAFDESSGEAPKPSILVTDEAKESVARGTEYTTPYFSIKVAKGFVDGRKVMLTVVDRSGLAEVTDGRGGKHPTHSEASYDESISDDVTAGFTDIDGEQHYVERAELPEDHPQREPKVRKKPFHFQAMEFLVSQ